jgi:hypothetical protein
MRIKIIALTICAWFFAYPTNLSAQQLPQTVPKIYVVVRIDVGDGKALQNLPAEIDLQQPELGDLKGFGFFITYSKEISNQRNCDGISYAYDVLNIDPDWRGIVLDPEGKPLKVLDPVTKREQVVECDEKHLEAYWDWVFPADKGYEKISKVDWTTNCHGHAFGVPDWPHTAVELLNLQTPAVGPVIHKACYEESVIKDATVASVPPSHSIKIVGGTCPIAQPPGQPVPANPGQPVAPVATDIVKESTQKYNESGVYRQKAKECPDSVVLTASELLKGFVFKYYKQKN